MSVALRLRRSLISDLSHQNISSISIPRRSSSVVARRCLQCQLRAAARIASRPAAAAVFDPQPLHLLASVAEAHVTAAAAAVESPARAPALEPHGLLTSAAFAAAAPPAADYCPWVSAASSAAALAADVPPQDLAAVDGPDAACGPASADLLADALHNLAVEVGDPVFPLAEADLRANALHTLAVEAADDLVCHEHLLAIDLLDAYLDFVFCLFARFDDPRVELLHFVACHLVEPACGSVDLSCAVLAALADLMHCARRAC